MNAQLYPQYKYVDIHRVDADGTRQKWKRIPATSLDRYRNVMVEANAQHCFSTIQSFASSVHLENEDEMYICPLYFDLDSDDDVEIALEDARKLSAYFSIGLDMEDDVKYWFSGNRGFHITIDYGFFGAEPSTYLVKIWRGIAEHITKRLELKTFDRSVYSKRRMWRLENTKHGKSGLWKIRLYPTELNMNVAEIKKLAAGPREGFEDG